MLGLHVCTTTPGLRSIIDQTHGFVHAWQILYQLGCIPSLKTHNSESIDKSLKMIYLTVNINCMALHPVDEL